MSNFRTATPLAFKLLCLGAAHLMFTPPVQSQVQNVTEYKPIEIIRLWDGPAPDAAVNAGEEKTIDGRVGNVTVPTITVYLPPKEKATGEALIICSGGGYSVLAVEKHGKSSAGAFLPEGIAVIALKYRTVASTVPVRQQAVADGERAIRLVRSRAKEWNIDPNRIGIIGHSAGANLIINLLTKFDAGNPNSPDPIERESSRPNVVGLMSSWAGGQKVADLDFLKDAPPAFFCITEDDKTAGTAFTNETAAKLKALGIPAQVQTYPAGGHEAFTIGQGAHGNEWPPLFLNWLRSLSTDTHKTIAVQTPQSVIVFGDSITEGNAMPVNERPRLWVRQIEESFEGKLQLINQGKGGRPTASLSEFDAMLAKQPTPKLLVIALGANDARDISDSCVPKAVANVESMIAKVRARYSEKLPILLVGPTNINKKSLGPTRPIANERETKVKELGAAFETLAKAKGCSFVSLYGVVPDSSLTRDGVHPDAIGNDAIAKVMQTAIQKALVK